MSEADERVVHPRWRRWVADNLVRGADRDTLVRELVGEGLAHVTARVLVENIATEACGAVAQHWYRRAQALEAIVTLRHAHRGRAPIERTPLPSVAAFKRDYWSPGVPVVITDLVPRWPAYQRWSLADLAARFGEVELEACVGRANVARPDADWKPLTQRMSIAALVAAIEAGAGNDVYVIAKNDALCAPGLQGLLDEIGLPPAFFGATKNPKRMALWLGGAHTHTPLHHDTDNSIFCQVLGRKRFLLAPPESLALLERSDGLYCRWDPTPEQAAARDAPEDLQELVLHAGEALFIPAGWWHQVDALDASISVSNLQWAWPNDFGWYKPGTRLAGRTGA